MKAGKFITIVGTVLAAGALASAPLVASADSDVDAAAFVGHTTSLTPVLLVGGGGTYSFTSDACVGVSSDVDAGLCTIGSSGSYTNIVCGTGSVFNATATQNETGPGVGGGGSDTVGITITFVAGVGVVQGGATGAVVLIGTGPGTDGNTCVTGFDVVGAAAIG